LYTWLQKRVDFASIPVVLVPSEAGPLLKDYIATRPGLRAQLRITPAVARFGVDEAMLCEHVGVRVRTSHPSRQDLRITLVSPQGTRSILQTINADQAAGPVDWTYYSVHHFYELSSGLWTLEVTDEIQGLTGDLLETQLIINGTPIVDLDDDGLDDAWELANFLNLEQSGLDDPDGDGSWNAREQILGTNPKVNQVEFKLVTSIVQSNAVRVAFPTVEGRNYLIRSGTDLNQPLQNASTVPGKLGETEITTPLSEGRRFFQIQQVQ
jgi:subtilisin-like proprotein convertase family protein